MKQLRYKIHFYCLAVEASFYSNVVECRTLNLADRVRSPVGEKCDLDFFLLSYDLSKSSVCYS